ncbi:stalk domain-containing protein [Paenibacillus sp. y28]|uniref:stalk domain-containing protein n=1 Tax=Paenibacillus sp. y28 TaxID=3129110 RepID=UPI0030196F28
MKKYVAGVLTGVLLTCSVTAFADDARQIIGKAVDGTLSLVIDGKASPKDVIVIEGDSYFPVRAAGEIFGYEVGYDDAAKQVKLTKPNKGATGTGGTNADKPLAVKSSDLALNSTKVYLVVQENGDQYLPVMVFEKYVSNDGQYLTVNLGPGKIISFANNQPYEAGIAGYVSDQIYVKLSALGLKASVRGNNIILDRLQ